VRSNAYLAQGERVMRPGRCVWRAADALQGGILGINEGMLAAGAALFGAVKESGYGAKACATGWMTTCTSSTCAGTAWPERA